MELKIKIGLEELLSAIKQLPENQLNILKRELDKKTANVKNAGLKELMLKGPVMSDEQYKEFKATRKQMNQWRTK